MKDEILGGIRNALERGVSLDKAAQSFINAGYGQQDVQEAVQALGGISAQITAAPLTAPSSPGLSRSAQSPQIYGSSTSAPLTPSSTPGQKSATWRYVLIGLSIVIVLLIASLIGVIAFSDQVLEWLKPAA